MKLLSSLFKSLQNLSESYHKKLQIFSILMISGHVFALHLHCSSIISNKFEQKYLSLIVYLSCICILPSFGVHYAEIAEIFNKLVRPQYLTSVFERWNVYKVMTVVLKLLSKGLSDCLKGEKFVETTRNSH